MAPSSDEETKIRLFLVPKTVQPKVEIKTIPKSSPTPPPVSVTGTTVTASEVTEKVTIKKEVPILEKPAVSGNDAKIELKIGIGKDGSHFDQSPTTDRLIKLDKSPIIDHIRKASFAKNATVPNSPYWNTKQYTVNQGNSGRFLTVFSLASTLYPSPWFSTHK